MLLLPYLTATVGLPSPVKAPLRGKADPDLHTDLTGQLGAGWGCLPEEPVKAELSWGKRANSFLTGAPGPQDPGRKKL